MKTYIVLSGLVKRAHEETLLNFWTGFINIQESLNTLDEIVIVGHSWNKEYKELLESVYGGNFSFSDFSIDEKTNSAIKKINNILKSKDHIPNFIYFYQSREIALRLLSSFKILESDRVILTRYDIGYRFVTPEVSEILIDDNFPRSYIYLPYHRDIDEGYGDQWFVFPSEHIALFENIFIGIISLLNSQEYFQSYTRSWPNAIKKNYVSDLFFYFYKNVVWKIIKFLDNFGKNSIYFWIKKTLVSSVFFIMGANAEMHAFEGQYFSKHSIEESINTHALLKKYFLDMGVRNQLRFLSNRDITNRFKRVINYKPYNIILNAISVQDIRIKDYLERMKSILYLGNEVNIWVLCDKELDSALGFYFDFNLKIINLPKDNLQLKEILDDNKVYLYLNVNKKLPNTINRPYFNSLVHYMIYSKIDIIKLFNGNFSVEFVSNDFPKLAYFKSSKLKADDFYLFSSYYAFYFVKELETNFCNSTNPIGYYGVIHNAIEFGILD